MVDMKNGSGGRKDRETKKGRAQWGWWNEESVEWSQRKIQRNYGAIDALLTHIIFPMTGTMSKWFEADETVMEQHFENISLAGIRQYSVSGAAQRPIRGRRNDSDIRSERHAGDDAGNPGGNRTNTWCAKGSHSLRLKIAS